MKESTVYILGAGCSYAGDKGYPLASEFIESLSAFGSKISSKPACRRIHKAVQDTVALLNACQSWSCHASTIDWMINLILREQCDDLLTAIAGVNSPSIIQIDELQRLAVRKAKVATAACLLDKEDVARGALIDRYRDFIQRKILHDGGPSTPTLHRLRQSGARVLSFNYDRMFELAFFAAFGDASLRGQYAYGTHALNSGLQLGGKVGEFDPGTFCFLKVHGSIGLMCNQDGFGQQVRQLSDIASWASPTPTSDSTYFSDQPTWQTWRDPLIVFPYEKDFVMSNNNSGLVFRDYIKSVWEHASQTIQEASEIWVIGYSFDPTDRKYLINLLKKAKNCKRIVIQNLKDECDRIDRLLRIEEKLEIPIVKNETVF